MSEAINQDPVLKQKANWNAVYAMTIGVAGLIIAEFLPAGLLTPIAKDLAITEGTAGQAVTATSLFAVITSLLVAIATRNWNRRTVLLTLSALLSVSSLVVALAPNLITLLFGRVLLGISLGGFWSMAAAITIRLVPEKDVGKALAIIFGGSSLASVLAAPLGSFGGDLIGWRNVFLFASAVGGLAFIWQMIALPSLRPLGVTRLRTTIDVLKVPQFGAGLVAIAFVFGGRFASFTYLRPFLEQTTKATPLWVSALLLLNGVSYFIGNWFTPGLIKKGIRSALLYSPVILAIVSVGLLIFGTSLPATVGLIFLWGAGFGPIPAGWSTWVAMKVPDKAETAGGLYVASVQMAAAIGAFAGGIFFDLNGSTGVIVLSAVAWLLSATAVFVGMPNRRL